MYLSRYWQCQTRNARKKSKQENKMKLRNSAQPNSEGIPICITKKQPSNFRLILVGTYLQTKGGSRSTKCC